MDRLLVDWRMILNAYAVLDGFASLVRLCLGLLVLGLGLPAWWRWNAALPADRRKPLEDRSYFLFHLAVVLLLLNLASWPLFYLLLQSYVPEWPGVMCIYGVMRVGTGSMGPSRFLPGLLTTLQVLKPALVFVTGAWFVLHMINRRTRTAPLMPRVLLMLVLLGLVAVADAALEGAYLVIPKKEEFLAAGCCTASLDDRSSSTGLVSGVLASDEAGPWVSWTYYGVNVGMCLALAGSVHLIRRRPAGAPLTALGVGAAVSLPVNVVFLSAIAAPVLLHLPFHHCPYDLLPAVPESVVAIALFVLGSFAVLWACVAGWFGTSAETRPFLGREVGKLLHLGLWGYAGSVVMLSLEMVVA
jgi:hypothetical protein